MFWWKIHSTHMERIPRCRALAYCTRFFCQIFHFQFGGICYLFFFCLSVSCWSKNQRRFVKLSLFFHSIIMWHAFSRGQIVSAVRQKQHTKNSPSVCLVHNEWFFIRQLGDWMYFMCLNFGFCCCCCSSSFNVCLFYFFYFWIFCCFFFGSLKTSAIIYLL